MTLNDLEAWESARVSAFDGMPEDLFELLEWATDGDPYSPEARTEGLWFHRLSDGTPFVLPDRIHDRVSERCANLLGGVQAIERRIQTLLTIQTDMALAARQDGASWDAIGWAFGLTGEACRRRYRDMLEDRPDLSAVD